MVLFTMDSWTLHNLLPLFTLFYLNGPAPSASSCTPIYVRWPRVRLALRPRVEGPYSATACRLACNSNEHPARAGDPLPCAGFNHKRSAADFGNDCQLYQADQLQNVDGYAEADDRYSFFWKYCVESENVCQAEHHFTFYTDRYMDSSQVSRSDSTNSLEECLAACLDEKGFTCRSASFNRTDGGCHLSAQNQLSKPRHIRLNNNPNFRIDYYESTCHNNTFHFTHTCEPTGARVRVSSQLAYTGALYGLYDYFTCRTEPNEQRQFEYFFPLPEVSRNCSDSIRVKDDEYIVEVVLSTDGVEPLYFITPEDLTYQAKCPLVKGGSKESKFKPELPEQATAIDAPDSIYRVLEQELLIGNSSNRDPIKIGKEVRAFDDPGGDEQRLSNLRLRDPYERRTSNERLHADLRRYYHYDLLLKSPQYSGENLAPDPYGEGYVTPKFVARSPNRSGTKISLRWSLPGFGMAGHAGTGTPFVLDDDAKTSINSGEKKGKGDHTYVTIPTLRPSRKETSSRFSSSAPYEKTKWTSSSSTSTAKERTEPPTVPTSRRTTSKPTTTSSTTRQRTTTTSTSTSTTTTTTPTTTTPTTTTTTTTTPRPPPSTTTSSTTTPTTTTTTTAPAFTTTTEPVRPILFDVFNAGQPVKAVVVGTRVALSFTPYYAIPPAFMSVVACQVEPVGSLYEWEREPLPIVRDGCQADSVGLVCPPEKTDFGTRVKVEAFRYQTTAQVQYTCLVRVCPYGPCEQAVCPFVEGCGGPLYSQSSFAHGRNKRQLISSGPQLFGPNGPVGNIRIPQIAGSAPTIGGALFNGGQRGAQLPNGGPFLQQDGSLLGVSSAPSPILRQHLQALAGDHIVRRQLIVLNSENELQYYLRTGSVPTGEFDAFFGAG